MKTKRLAALLALGSALILSSLGLQAQTLRWASQGDMQTADPHSQNEVLTNSLNALVYERLVGRDKQLGIVPALATEWTQVSPTLWRLKLRPGVKWQDGSAFTADDVVFSIQRAKEPSSQVAVYAQAVGMPRKVDELTVEFQLEQIGRASCRERVSSPV